MNAIVKPTCPPLVWPPQQNWGCTSCGQNPCQCGCQACPPPNWGTNLTQCYADLAAFKQMVTQIVNDILASQPPAQAFITEAPLDGQSYVRKLAAWAALGGDTHSGIPGVTDGSDAAPGMIGEYIETRNQISIANTVGQTGTINAATLQPGDWNIFATMQIGSYIAGFQMELAPLPVGVSNDMRGTYGFATPAGSSGANAEFNVSSPVARASIKVATPFVFAYIINPWGAPGTPTVTTGTLIFAARRMR